MPLNPRSLHAAEHTQPDPGLTSPGFREWSQAAGDSASRTTKPRPSQVLLPGIDFAHPLAQIAVVAFIGYTLGRLMHRRSRKVPMPSSAPAQSPYRPGATEPYRVQPIRDRSSIRYR